MNTEDKAKLENYIRETLTKVGKSKEDIDAMVERISSLKFMQSREAVDAFIKASQS